jgi:hypothetical protein
MPDRAIIRESNCGSNIWQVTDNFDLDLGLTGLHGIVSQHTTVTDAGVWYIAGEREGSPVVLKVRVTIDYEKEATQYKTVAADIESEVKITVDSEGVLKLCTTETHLLVVSDT